MTHIPVGQMLVGALAGSSIPFTALSADAYLSARIFNRQSLGAPSAFETPNPVVSQVFANRNNYNSLSFSLFPQADGSQLVTLIQSLLPHPPHIPEVLAGSGITVVLNARGYVISASGAADPDIVQIRALTPRIPWLSSIDPDIDFAKIKAFTQHPPRMPEVVSGQNIALVQDARGYIVSALMDIDNIKTMLGRTTSPLVPSLLPVVQAPPDIIQITSGQRRIDTPTFFSQDDITAIAALLRHNPRIPEVQAGTNVTIAQNARGPVISASGGGGGGANVGTATINFGAFPGASDTSVAVTGQAGIVVGSIVNAWMYPSATADHSADEHMLETIRIFAGNIIAGTGFTIYGFNTSQFNEPLPDITEALSRVAALLGPGQASKQAGYSRGGAGTRIYGQWTVAWQWS